VDRLPDEALQQGMAQVREALDSFESAHADERSAIALVAKTQAGVAHIFAHCQLAPAADADLHVLLAELLAGSEALKDGRVEEGRERVERALDTYGAVFPAR
jgi:hypothetical protein